MDALAEAPETKDVENCLSTLCARNNIKVNLVVILSRKKHSLYS